MHIVRSLAFAATLAAAFAGAPALAFDPESASEVNLDERGFALQGYDPVAYFTLGKPVKGDPAITEAYKGSRYAFANAEDRALFAKDPEKYAPAFGGFCALATAFGKKADIDPEAWKIVDGKLYVNNSKAAAVKWQSDIPGFKQKAEVQWPKISVRPPKDL